MKLHSLATLCGLFCLATLTSVHADEVIKTFPGGGAEDILNKPPGGGEKPVGAIKMNKKCRNDKGTLISEGEKGYDDCLSKMLKRPARSPLPEVSEDGKKLQIPSGKPQAPKPRGPSSELTNEETTKVTRRDTKSSRSAVRT